ncbi:MAG: recombinase family protein [bacterium]|nr:recombinase family protein [bacterium]
MSDKKYFIYARKSTDDKDHQIRSLPDQLAELRELAKKEKIDVVDTFVEKQTAKVPGRPIFAEMIARIERGEASGILAWHPDRLARNSVDGGKIIYLVDTGTITDLKFPTFWFDATPQGKFMLSISFGQSKYYVDNLSENIKRGHRQKLKNGIWPQKAPLGYLNDKIVKSIIVDPVKSLLVIKTFEAYATGDFTFAQVRQKINDLGLKGTGDGLLSISNYQYLLKNPFYYGIIRYGGEFYEGKHPAIISKKLFDDVQEVMTRKSKPKTKELLPYAYRGFFHCGECGCFITTEQQKGHNYLRCTKRKGACLQKYVREEIITSQIQSELKKYSLADDVADWLIAEVEKEKSESEKAINLQIQKVTSEVTVIDTKLDKLMTAYLENALTLPEYQETKNKLMLEKHTLKDKLSAFEQSATIRFEPVVKFFNDCKQTTILAKSSDPLKLREFFKKIGSNPLVLNRIFTFTPGFPFAFFPKFPSKIRHGAGVADGGFQGGIPPRPPHSAIPSPFFANSATFTFSRNCGG